MKEALPFSAFLQDKNSSRDLKLQRELLMRARCRGRKSGWGLFEVLGMTSIFDNAKIAETDWFLVKLF